MEIRGIWITTTASQVLNSRQNIAEAMNFLADTGFNVVFPVVWNNGETIYPSKVMGENFGIEINQRFKGRDPLAELIAEAKRVNIAVIPWFEYGFASSYQKQNDAILTKKPEWAAIDATKKTVVKNGFTWLNAFDSQVQEFLLSLFIEVVKNYEIAGIQGDDRFPALPSEAGYDDKTIARYNQEFNQSPPANIKDPTWLQWRADILSNFLTRVYREIINIKPELIISLSPSVYPWGYENYLQDSQAWVDLGLVDLIHPQVYWKEFDTYKRDIDRFIASNFSKQQLPQLVPGILLKQSTYRILPEYLVQAIKYNRSVGLQGELLFFYEGLREDNNALAKVLKSEVYAKPPGKFDPKEIKNNSFTHRRVNSHYITRNISQEIILKAQFDWVEPFSQGIAAVKMGYKYAYIDKTGKLLTRFDYDVAEPCREGLALVKFKNLYGYIDVTGNLKIKQQFNDAKSFSESLAAVKKGDKWAYIGQGYIGNNVPLVIPANFEDAKSFFEGLAAVKIADKWGYIDKQGNGIIQFNFDDASNFSAGLALVKFRDKLGYIDKNGNYLIQPQFDDADIFSEGLAPAKLGNKWGYINQYAEFTIPPNFDNAKPFVDGMALVNVGDKWGYIRKF